MRSVQYQADGLLFLVAMIWGLTFVVVKNAVVDIAPFTFNFVRFTLAFLSLLLFCRNCRQRLNRKLFFYGILTGLFLFGGYSFQTFGLQYTSASNAGFITGLSVVLVPLILVLTGHTRLSVPLTLGVISATAGLALLTLQNGFKTNPGDLLVLGCAFSFALHIILVDRFTGSFDTLIFVTIQIGSVALVSGFFSLALETASVSLTGNVVLALVVTAIPATTLAYFIQNWAQRFTNPTRTAIILALEPVFAMLFAFFLLREPLGGRELAGAALMLAGMLVSELRSSV